MFTIQKIRKQGSAYRRGWKNGRNAGRRQGAFWAVMGMLAIVAGLLAILP